MWDYHPQNSFIELSEVCINLHYSTVLENSIPNQWAVDRCCEFQRLGCSLLCLNVLTAVTVPSTLITFKRLSPGSFEWDLATEQYRRPWTASRVETRLLTLFQCHLFCWLFIKWLNFFTSCMYSSTWSRWTPTSCLGVQLFDVCEVICSKPHVSSVVC